MSYPMNCSSDDLHLAGLDVCDCGECEDCRPSAPVACSVPSRRPTRSFLDDLCPACRHEETGGSLCGDCAIQVAADLAELDKQRARALLAVDVVAVEDTVCDFLPFPTLAAVALPEPPRVA